MNYIILGGTGFIGTHLANLLHERYPQCKVWNLDIVDPARLDSGDMTEKEIENYTTIKHWKSPVVDGETRNSTYVYCDVRKPIEDLPFTPTADDIIFNFAAVHRTPGHPDIAYFETNIRGAENVCAFAEKYGIKRIVFTSSIAPYGAAEELKTEETLPTPNTPYGISKLVAEKIHVAWQAKDSSHRQLLIVRPGVVFGKGENGNFTRLYQSIRGRKFIYPGRKDTIKACIYVKELVRFIDWCLDNQKNNVEIYNCTFEPAYSIEHIVETIKDVTGLKRRVPLIPSRVLMPVATLAACIGSPMGICPARVRKLMVSTNINGKKLANSGYKFRYTLEEAIADWYSDNGGKWLK
ncbi:MAG: NAD(P)-dependent oxidoreductase [Prevotella sp.]|nr:NAD(P)-dependent oxidoreductase [Prevotella sp.]